MKKNTTSSVRASLAPATAMAASSESLGMAAGLAALGRLLASQRGGSDQKPKETVRVQRRRRTDTGSSQPRERAEAPRRQRPSAQPPTTSGGGGTGGFSGGTGGGGFFGGSGGTSGTGGGGVPMQSLLRNLPTGGRSLWLILGLLVVVCICGFLAMSLLSGGGSDGGGQESFLQPQPTDGPEVLAPTPRPAATATRFVPPAASGEGQSWLVMLYQDADDKILERDIYLDLNEAERAGSSDRVQIVAQLDRYAGGFAADGNWQ